MTTEFTAPGALRRARHDAAESRPVRRPDETASAFDVTLRDAESAAPDPSVSSGSSDASNGSGAPHWGAIDALRGLAVAGVVAYHLGWISGGFLGVDLFFALSGFLITTLLVREQRARGRIDLLAFWGRRFRRLLPAVMLLVVAVLAWLAVWGTAAEQAGGRTDGRWSIAYLANWHQIAAARDYWAAATDATVFTHLWSLAIEEQFYLVWPLVAWWALRSRGGERLLALVATGGVVASLVAMVILHDPDSPSRVYLGTDTRAAALLLGALVALNPLHRRLCAAATWRPRQVDVLIGSIGTLLAIWWVVGGDHLDVLLNGGITVHSLLAAIVVAAVATSSSLGGNAARMLDRRWLVWLGARSYGLYLWHWPVILLARPRWDGLSAPVRDLLMIALSLVLTEVSYQLVEHPVRRRVGWAAGRRATGATLAVTALAVVAAVAAPSGRGHVAGFDLDAAPLGSIAAPAPGPIATEAPDVSVALDAADALDARPMTAGSTTPATTAWAPSAPIDGARTGVAVAATAPPAPRPVVGRVLWLGDSVAADLAPALTAAFGAAGVSWIDGAGDGLRFTPGGGVDPVALYGELFGTAPLDPAPSDTAPSSPAPSNPAPFDTVVLQLSYWDAPADLDQLRASFGWMLDQMTMRDARLVVLTAPPVRADLADPGMQRQLEVIGELVRRSDGRVTLVDTSPAWGTEMLADIDGDLAPDRKPDGVHVCPQGAARLAAWLVADLAQRFEGIAVAPADVWLASGWAVDPRYDTPTGSCVALG